jgi:plastocyanin
MRARATLFTIVAMGAMVFPVAPARAGGFCMGDVPFTDARTTTVEMKRNCFGPTVARIDAGDTVAFVNADGEVHSVGGANGTFGNAHAEILPGDEVSFTFDREGVFPYVCIFHPGMSGAVVVGGGTGKVSSAAGITSGSAKDQSQPNRAEPISDSSGDGIPAGMVAAAAALVVVSAGALVRFREPPAAAPVREAATPRR